MWMKLAALNYLPFRDTRKSFWTCQLLAFLVESSDFYSNPNKKGPVFYTPGLLTDNYFASASPPRSFFSLNCFHITHSGPVTQVEE